MKKAVRGLMMVFAVAFGLLIFTGTGKAATTWNAGLRQTNYGYAGTSVEVSWNPLLVTEVWYTAVIGVSPTSLTREEKTSRTSVDISGLSEGGVYYVQVRAYSDYERTMQIGASDVIQVATRPSAPTGLMQTSATTNSISMKWNPVYGATSYSVYRYNSYNNYTPIATTAATSCTVKGLGASSKVAYAVIANVTTVSGFTSQSYDSNYVYMYTVPGKVAYIAMTNYWDSLQEAKYEWNSVNNASGYQFQLQTYKGKNLLTKDTGSSFAANYIYVKPFKKGIFTKARARAYIIINNKKIYGAWSNLNYNASAKKVTLRRKGNKIKVTWKKISGAAGYTVMISTKSKSGFKKVKTLGKKSTSITIKKCGKKKLKRSKRYYIRVKYLTKVGKKKVASGVMGTGSI